MEALLCCDKCRRLVDPKNDAVRLELVDMRMKKYGPDYRPQDCDNWEYTAILNHGARHLLPVVEDGVVICEGSPSRAQYIEGQPKDTRGFAYTTQRELELRAAYARLQSSDDI